MVLLILNLPDFNNNLFNAIDFMISSEYIETTDEVIWLNAYQEPNISNCINLTFLCNRDNVFDSPIVQGDSSRFVGKDLYNILSRFCLKKDKILQVSLDKLYRAFLLLNYRSSSYSYSQIEGIEYVCRKGIPLLIPDFSDDIRFSYHLILDLLPYFKELSSRTSMKCSPSVNGQSKNCYNTSNNLLLPGLHQLISLSKGRIIFPIITDKTVFSSLLKIIGNNLDLITKLLYNQLRGSIKIQSKKEYWDDFLDDYPLLSVDNRICFINKEYVTILLLLNKEEMKSKPFGRISILINEACYECMKSHYNISVETHLIPDISYIVNDYLDNTSIIRIIKNCKNWEELIVELADLTFSPILPQYLYLFLIETFNIKEEYESLKSIINKYNNKVVLPRKEDFLSFYTFCKENSDKTILLQ